MISQYVMHGHPQYWDEPCHFNPQRFLDKDNLQNYTFLPFLIGPRRCLGKSFALLEVRIFLAHWIDRFTFEKVEGVVIVLTTINGLLSGTRFIKSLCADR